MQTNIKTNSFKVWRTIELGTFKRRRDLLNALDKKGKLNCVDGSYSRMLTRMSIAKKRVRLNLVKIRPKDIGFVVPETRWGEKIFMASQLNRHALSIGLRLCPAEVALQLCLQSHLYISDVTIGMKPTLIRFNDFDEGPGSNEIVWGLKNPGLYPSLGGYYWDNEFWIYVKPNQSGNSRFFLPISQKP